MQDIAALDLMRSKFNSVRFFPDEDDPAARSSIVILDQETLMGARTAKAAADLIAEKIAALPQSLLEEKR